MKAIGNIQRHSKETLCLLLALLLCGTFYQAEAQQTTRGKEFYFSFLPNFHSKGNTSDSLYVYIVADVPTTGSIEYRTRMGTRSTVPFSITDPSRIYVMRLSWRNYELLGYNQEESFDTDNDNEAAAKQVFHVTANNDVAVYALNKAVTTSDATLVLPNAALGKEYMVLSYNSNGILERGGSLHSNYTPSQFAVIATEDNTDIQISPSVPTTESGSSIKNIRLQRGEAYLVQSQFSTRQLNYDLSGTTISATKPVAVYTGHQRATIPISVSDGSNSRDCLFKSLLPLSVWGTRYVITPFAQPSGGTWSTVNDVYRVIAAEDSTVVRFNDKVITTLNKGKVYETALTQAGYLTSTKRVLVALYKKSHNRGGSTSGLGDPFMMIIPPRRQYLNKYRFTNVQANSAYQEQYITIIAALNVTGDILLDGRKVTAVFRTIPNSCFAYTTLPMTDGAHTLECPQPVGLYVYGYGAADSYGYVGGMAFIPDADDGDIDAGPDLRVCNGSSVQLEAKRAAKSIRWTPSKGLSCDTCRITKASPTATTTYIVSAIDSVGCESKDTIVVTVRDLISNFRLGSAETGSVMNVQVDSIFVLPVNGSSEGWQELSAKQLDVKIQYNPAFMLYLNKTENGSDLSSDWHISYDSSLSNPEKGILVLHAKGDTAIRVDGEYLKPYFRSLLAPSFSDAPILEVLIKNSAVECISEESKGVEIQTGVCVGNLRHVSISPIAFGLTVQGANPVTTQHVAVEYSLAFPCDTDLRLMDATGKEIRTLVRSTRPAGLYTESLDTQNLGNGVYYLVLRASENSFVKPLLINR